MSTANANPYQAFIDSKLGSFFIKVMLKDIDTAVANAKRLQSSGVAKSGGSKALSAWKREVAQLKDLRGELTDEMKAVRKGDAKSLDMLQEIHGDCGTVLDLVEQRNHAYQMIVNAQIDVKIATMLPLLVALSSEGSRAMLLNKQMQGIIKDLNAASKKAKSKAAKAALSGALVAASFMLPPLGIIGATLAVAASLIASDIGGRSIDYALGEKSGPPDALRSVYTIADGSIGAAGQANKAAAALGKKTAAVGVAIDGVDAGFAYYKQKGLEKRLVTIRKEIEAHAKSVQEIATQVVKMQKDAVSRLKQARKDAGAFSSSKAARDRVNKDFNKYHDMN